MKNRPKSPSGRLHVFPGDRVQHVSAPQLDGRVMRLDDRESHVEALVEWCGLRGGVWEDLNVLRPVDR